MKQYCFKSTYKKQTFRQHVVTDEGEEEARFIALRRLRVFWNAEFPDFTISLEFIKDMEGVTLYEN